MLSVRSALHVPTKLPFSLVFQCFTPGADLQLVSRSAITHHFKTVCFCVFVLRRPQANINSVSTRPVARYEQIIYKQPIWKCIFSGISCCIHQLFCFVFLPKSAFHCNSGFQVIDVFHFPKCMKQSTNKTGDEIFMIVGGFTLECSLLLQWSRHEQSHSVKYIMK